MILVLQSIPVRKVAVQYSKNLVANSTNLAAHKVHTHWVPQWTMCWLKERCTVKICCCFALLVALRAPQNSKYSVPTLKDTSGWKWQRSTQAKTDQKADDLISGTANGQIQHLPSDAVDDPLSRP